MKYQTKSYGILIFWSVVLSATAAWAAEATRAAKDLPKRGKVGEERALSDRPQRDQPFRPRQEGDAARESDVDSRRRDSSGDLLNNAARRADANRDGAVSRDEFLNAMGAVFNRIDSNRDGKLDRRELATLTQRPERPREEDRPRGAMPESLARFDKNGDGKISSGEFQGPAEMFKRLDANGDGSLTAEEVGERLRSMGRPRGIESDRGKTSYFEQNDKNKDGKLSPREFGAPERVFDRIDVNKDGFVTPEEMERVRGGMSDEARGAGGMLRRGSDEAGGKSAEGARR